MRRTDIREDSGKNRVEQDRGNESGKEKTEHMNVRARDPSSSHSRLSLAIYTLLRYERALCEGRRAVSDSSEKCCSSRPVKLEGRLRHKVHMDDECFVVVIVVVLVLDR
ncbi:uncharacterized protein LOC109504618 [Harpegnathos saltator]|uniref:uncharacterized protein LOC109504618 n=1 Tax=Harpegnathos saltator TaxID=610380 RepID=UPI000DBEE54F|nr:uncharacterized protein LOC109504618 [Harpegnathos saltator]